MYSIRYIINCKIQHTLSSIYARSYESGLIGQQTKESVCMTKGYRENTKTTVLHPQMKDKSPMLE